MISFNKEQFFIVTGASSGIGEGVALLLNELGASVVGIGRNQQRLEAMKSKAKFPENIFLEQKDLAEDIEGLPAYVKSLKDKYGKFQGMAYCAGISAVSPAKVFDFEFAKKVFNINYFSPIFMTKGMIDRRNNVGKGCSLVYLSSIDALVSSRGQSLYAGAKAALDGTIKAISREVSSVGMRLNCVLPSMIKTPMTQTFSDETGTFDNASEAYPFGWGEPQDVASMVAFLLSDKAKYISGQKYVVDSGGVL